MRFERNIFAGLFGFFAIVTVIYWFSSHEIIGTVALGLTAVLFALVVGYLQVIGRKIDRRPEDNPDGEIYEGAGELGFFPPQSIWPFWVALTLAVTLLGPIFGWWLSIIGFGLGMWALSGWVYEFYRGDYAH